MEPRRHRRAGPTASRLHLSRNSPPAISQTCNTIVIGSLLEASHELIRNFAFKKALHTQHMKTIRLISLSTAALALALSLAQAQPTLIAIGSLTESRNGPNVDLSGLTYPLENLAPANLLGGLGSAITYDSGKKFLLLPDRGPNAVTFDTLIDNTVSYVNRFHTVQMDLDSNPAGPLPFTLRARLQDTTLLGNASPLVYGTGSGLGVGPGAPPINNAHRFFFSGRSDNFDATRNSGNPAA